MQTKYARVRNAPRWSRIAFTLMALPALLAQPSALAQSKKDPPKVLEDQLNPENMNWAGEGLPLNKVANIVDTLTSQPVGTVIIDRNAVTTSAQGAPLTPNLLGSSVPEPGLGIAVSVWGSKIEGCFVEVYLQLAPANGRIDQQSLTPTLLEMGVNGQVIQLPARTNATPKFSNKAYTYYGPGMAMYRSIWYGNRTLFSIDATIVNILINAPAVETRARLTLATGETVLIRLDKRIAGGWKEAFAFNPTCRSTRAIQPQPALAASPLVNALNPYRNSPAQHPAVQGWLALVQRPHFLELSR
jgi:hypothetical protein